MPGSSPSAPSGVWTILLRSLRTYRWAGRPIDKRPVNLGYAAPHPIEGRRLSGRSLVPAPGKQRLTQSHFGRSTMSEATGRTERRTRSARRTKREVGDEGRLGKLHYRRLVNSFEPVR